MDDAANTPPAAAPTPSPGGPTPSPDRVVSEPLAGMDDKKWSKAVVLVNGAKIMDGEKRGTIIVERFKDGVGVSGGYDKGADIYFGTSGQWAPSETDEDGRPLTSVAAPVADFKADPAARIVVLGQDVFQSGVGGLSSNPGEVNVFPPAGLAYGAVNLAYLQGADTIEVVGLTPEEKALLQPVVDKTLASAGVQLPGSVQPMVREKLKITLT